MNRILMNAELTAKAVYFINKHGRNTLDEMARNKSKEELIAEGWIKEIKIVEKGDWS